MPNNLTPFEFQRAGVNWLQSERRNPHNTQFVCEPHCGLLGDEMGLGKTAQALLVIRDMIRKL